jgi:hypothetical protein
MNKQDDTSKPAKPLRSYTLTNNEDYEHVQNGRCPTYALCWSHESNKVHWPKGHNYLIGNNTQSLSKEELEVRTQLYIQPAESKK